MRAAQSGRSSTNIHADDGPFKSCGNPPTLGSGAGGNRTPVHQAMSVRDTTIPDFETDAISPTGRMFSIARKPRHVFACGQRTFSRSAFFLAVIPRFCCRAAVDRPRAPFLVTMSLYNLRIRRQERTAGWQFCFLPRLTILSKSGRTLGHRNSCRNLSAPITSMHSLPYR